MWLPLHPRALNHISPISLILSPPGYIKVWSTPGHYLRPAFIQWIIRCNLHHPQYDSSHSILLLPSFSAFWRIYHSLPLPFPFPTITPISMALFHASTGDAIPIFSPLPYLSSRDRKSFQARQWCTCSPSNLMYYIQCSHSKIVVVEAMWLLEILQQPGAGSGQAVLQKAERMDRKQSAAVQTGKTAMENIDKIGWPISATLCQCRHQDNEPLWPN